MRREIDHWMRHSLPGPSNTVVRTLERCYVVDREISRHWELQSVAQWQAKHVRWFLAVHAEEQGWSPATVEDYGRAAKKLLMEMGKWSDWKPHLRGPWLREGKGGRPLQVSERAKHSIGGSASRRS